MALSNKSVISVDIPLSFNYRFQETTLNKLMRNITHIEMCLQDQTPRRKYILTLLFKYANLNNIKVLSRLILDNSKSGVFSFSRNLKRELNNNYIAGITVDEIANFTPSTCIFLTDIILGITTNKQVFFWVSDYFLKTQYSHFHKPHINRVFRAIGIKSFNIILEVYVKNGDDYHSSTFENYLHLLVNRVTKQSYIKNSNIFIAIWVKQPLDNDMDHLYKQIDILNRLSQKNIIGGYALYAPRFLKAPYVKDLETKLDSFSHVQN